MQPGEVSHSRRYSQTVQKRLRYHQDILLLIKVLRLDCGRHHRQGGDCQVNLSVFQKGTEISVDLSHQPDGNVGVLLLKADQQRRNHNIPPGIVNPDAQQPPLIFGNVLKFPLQGARPPLKVQSVFQKHLPGVGQLQGDAAHQQLGPQLPLQLGDVGAEGLLGDVQPLRRPGEAPLPGHHDKVVHAGKVHPGPPSSFAAALRAPTWPTPDAGMFSTKRAPAVESAPPGRFLTSSSRRRPPRPLSQRYKF